MSLERKDVRFKLDANDHEALRLCAEAEDMDIAELVEQVVVRMARRRVHAAIILAKKAERAGIAGSTIPAEL